MPRQRQPRSAPLRGAPLAALLAGLVSWSPGCGGAPGDGDERPDGSRPEARRIVTVEASTPEEALSRSLSRWGWGPASEYASLLLGSDRYRRIDVEIVAVEGADGVQDFVDALRAFLERHCDKPDGVHFHRASDIPLARARRKPRNRLLFDAMIELPDRAEATAYLFVLIYDTRRLDALPENPHVRNGYPLAIYVDVAYLEQAVPWYSPWRAAAVRAETIRHEAGHALGLAMPRDGGHCTDSQCLMRPTLSSRTHLDLCERCREELDRARTSRVAPIYSFFGPFLVRSESRYEVLYAPGYLGLSFIDLDTIRPEHARQFVLEHLRSDSAPDVSAAIVFEGGAVDAIRTSETRFVPITGSLEPIGWRERLRPRVEAAKRDSDPGVVAAAERLDERLASYAERAGPTRGPNAVRSDGGQ